ncbi:TetR/AcrR family transcriptional regulator [Flexivirga caeni]|uniref:TetR/AcrR family transcriptional regulator n=1 Tax=Flexivirga caeni TaxID=2294115 RepID=A0A3M9MEC5_9MICO|nr:TetR/AcrR family transcriptional regulator [Flexivirga caeni]RNI23909.1 TetR/AcrR family transcriptional regulator [Flexivirga caeni]
MPRISDERRAARREQIISAALRCAIRSGFDGMTMAQVIEESDLSAGAVYGYFSGKAELIAAVVDSRLYDVIQLLSDAADAPQVPPIPELLKTITTSLETAAQSVDGDLTVLLQLSWAAAAKDPAILDLVRPRLLAVLDAWAAIVRRHQEAGTIDPAADPDDLARVLHSSVPGYTMLRLVGLSSGPDRFAAAWLALMGPAQQPAE